MWENITHQEKGGIVSHVATCLIAPPLCLPRAVLRRTRIPHSLHDACWGDRVLTCEK